VCPSSTARQGLAATFQSRSVLLSPDAESASAPSGENMQARTQLVCSSSMARQAPEAISQSRSVLSKDAEIASLPSGQNAQARTQLVTLGRAVAGSAARVKARNIGREEHEADRDGAGHADFGLGFPTSRSMSPSVVAGFIGGNYDLCVVHRVFLLREA
jgi:hypothetical protein